MTEGGIMAGSSVSEQARDALRTARALARDRGNPAPGSADLLLAAILGQWDDEHAGGPALLRACGLTAEQARQLNARLLSAYRDPEATTPVAKPYLIGSLRFVVDQAFRIAIEARAPYTGTEHLVVAVLWEDTQSSAHELRRQGVSYAQAVDVLATLPHSERIVAGEELDPLEAAPTPAVARLHELARQQAEQHPATGASARCTICSRSPCFRPRPTSCWASWASASRRWSSGWARRAPGWSRPTTGARRSCPLRAGSGST
jgi:ATP-dependent Clp protease ATP-binding subunit ClpA